MKGRVLLAEDDADQSDILAEYLKIEGYEVLLADSTLAVIQQLTRGPDVLLLDLNGIFHPALIRGLEALPNRPALVVLSADSHVEERARELRADAWLAKPYELEQLDATLRFAIAGRAMARQALQQSALA